MPVRLGAPQYAKGLSDIIKNPIYATAVGLLIYGARDDESSGGTNGSQLAGGFVTRVRDWFGRHF